MPDFFRVDRKYADGSTGTAYVNLSVCRAVFFATDEETGEPVARIRVMEEPKAQPVEVTNPEQVEQLRRVLERFSQSSQEARPTGAVSFAE